MSYLGFVPSATRLGPRDLDRALAVVAEAASIDGPQPFELPVIERLLALIPADSAGYFEFEKPRTNTCKVEQPYIEMLWDTDLIRAVIDTCPLAEHRAGAWEGTEHAVLLSDLLTPAQQRRNPWYLEVMRPRGERYELKMWLPAPSGIGRGFWFKRGPDSHDFDERDRAVLTVLRPYLATVRERRERCHRPALLLTPRETEILKLVRDGLTNREIAARLVISPGTVRSHLEHVFDKLKVRTRTAALACAFGANTH